MFQSLEAFRGQLKGLSIAINFAAGGQQFVMVTPVVTDDAKSKNPELAQPFSFTATAVELDEEFAKAIGELAGNRKSIADQVAAQAAALKAKATLSAAKPAPKKAGSVQIDEDDPADGAAVAEPAASPVPTPPPAGQLTADSLFELE